MRNMMSYNMTVVCGYDGCIIVGEDFWLYSFSTKIIIIARLNSGYERRINEY